MSNFLIVGGSSGIGYSLTKQLIHNGHAVWVASRSAGDIASLGATHITWDVQEPAPDWGNLPAELHGLAYCPGSINLKPFHRLKESDFQSDWDINVRGAIRALQAVLDRLKAGKGSVVFFSTVAVQTGMPFHTSVAAAKGALEGLTRSLAAEYAPTLRINAVAPSLTDTPLATRLLSSPEKQEASRKRHPLHQYGKPEDVAAVARFLLSEESAWITGQIWGVDGGMGSLKPV